MTYLTAYPRNRDPVLTRLRIIVHVTAICQCRSTSDNGAQLFCIGQQQHGPSLEKRLGLGLARSRSCLMANQTSQFRLGLMQLQEGLGLGLILVS